MAMIERTRRISRSQRAARHQQVIVVCVALALTLVIVLLPFLHQSDFVSDVTSMAILIGALTFARLLDRRSGVIVALLAGAVAAIVPGVAAFPPSSVWEATLRLGAFVTMTLVYYRVIATLRARDERAQRQLDDLRHLQQEVRALHTQATVMGGTRDAAYRQIVAGAAHLVGAPRCHLVQRSGNHDAWQIVAQFPDEWKPDAPTIMAPFPVDDTGTPTLTQTPAGAMHTVLITTGEVMMALAVDTAHENRDREEHAQLLAVYARDVHLLLEHLALQEQLAHLVRLEERGRIARELHDGLVQSLGGIAYRIEYYGDVLRAENVAAIRDELATSAITVRGALREARLMIHGLRDVRHSRDLRDRLLALIHTVSEETTMEIVSDLPPVIPVLPVVIVDAIVRIAQEALQNAMKHANAESVSLVLLMEAERVELTITDDGCGFVYCAHDGDAHPLRYGLIGMEERAAEQGGRLTIQTQPDMGTCVTLTLPVIEGNEDAA